MPKERLSVMISSTVLDLPEHRPEIRDACLQQEMQPLMMENLPPNDADAIKASMKLVNDADIYLGVIAYRYGYVPKKKNRKRISLTEMEYNRAVEREIPRLVFIIDEAHKILFGTVEMGVGAAKLEALKERLVTNNIVKSFKSPQDLRAHALNGLSELGKQYLQSINRPGDTNIFVAHSKYDWDKFVKPLVDRLRTSGFAVWAAQDQTNEYQLNQVLELCGWLVLCVSPSAVRSKLIKMQLDYFVENRKQVALLICRKATLPTGAGMDQIFTYAQIGELIKLIKNLREQSPFAKYES